jgi:septal ring factor EnvC (AmiA/AmiB activator)
MLRFEALRKLQGVYHRLTPEELTSIRYSMVVGALLGWVCFGFSLWSSWGLQAEIKLASAKYQALQDTSGDLKAVEAKLNLARLDHSQTEKAAADANTTLSRLQQEIKVSQRQLEQLRDRSSQTGSVRQSEQPKRATR